MSPRGLEILFERFRSHGDVAALGQMFDATAPALRQVARHLTRDRVEAEDLVQATFLAAIEKRATFDATREISPWLTGILLKHASLARRSRARVVEPDRLETQTSEDPLEVAAARELSEALTVALARLSPADRDVLIPLLLHGRRAVEIARELGRRPDTIHMRIHRGLARLRRLLPGSFAVAALLRIGHARGLSAVRSDVLRRAQLEFGDASVASVGGTALGVAMSMKKVAVLLALASCLGIGGYLVAARVLGGTDAHAVPLETAALAPSGEGLQEAQLGGAARAPAVELQAGSPVADPSAHDLVMEVVREGGQAAARALVALVDANGAVASARTDAEGRCSFAASKGSGHLYVRDEAALPHHETVELDAGRRTIVLPQGGELSGRLVLKGDAPFPRIDLRLTPDTAPVGLAEAGLAVFEALELVEYGVRKLLVARTTPSADGSFRFRGLEPGWSGLLVLPAELVFVDDSQPTRSSSRVCTRAATGLELGVAYRPRIIGRLVDAATREPLASFGFNGIVTFADGNTTYMGARSGEDGRFTIALEHRTDATQLAIDLVHGAGGRRARSESTVSWKGPCEPFDAGEIECTFVVGRPIVVRAVDPGGAPLPGSRADIRDLETVTADEQGVATFAAVPPEASEMRVAAPGHAIATVPLSAATASPLEVVLVPTNRLTIVLPREAAGRGDLVVELVSRQLLFGGKSRIYDWIRSESMVGRCLSADGDQGTKEGRVRFGFDTDGLLEVDGIQTGVPFRIRLVGSTFRGAGPATLAELAIDSLGPDERRRVDLVLDPISARSLYVLRGRAIDEQGRPILGAGIATIFDADTILAHTELDGSFRLDLTDQVLVDVEVTKRGYVPFRVRRWNLTSGRILDATLRRGHDLRVELVDDKGRAIRAAELRAWTAVFGSARGVEGGTPGVFTVCDLPIERAEITVDVGGKRYERRQDAPGDTLRIVLPEHGRLEVAWSFAGEPDPSKSYQLALRSVGSDGAMQTKWTPWVDRVMDHVFESVLPGNYTIGLEVDSNASDDARVYAPLREPVRVTITAEAHVRVDL